jgi:hypothetical protein
MIHVMVFVMNWNGTNALPHWVYAFADATDLNATGPPYACNVPDKTKEVRIKAQPVNGDRWTAEVTLTVDQNETLKLKDRGDALGVDIKMNGGALGVRFATVVIRLSRVKVVTDQIVNALRHVPDDAVQPGAHADLQRLIDAVNGQRHRAVAAFVGTKSPIRGTTLQLPSLEDVAMIDTAEPVLGGELQSKKATITPSNTTFVVEVAGVQVPRTIAVSWPDTVPRDKPAPMYVHFRHGPQQGVVKNAAGGMFGLFEGPSLDPYPYSFDYACFGLLTTLWYPSPPDVVPTAGQGVAYQIAAAGKEVVTVVACPSANAPPDKTQAGDWTSADTMQEVLLEIQALAAVVKSRTPPTTLGRVALGAFSSGNYHLLNLLKNEGHPFLTNTVKECYLFDPDNEVLGKYALNYYLLAWEKNVPSDQAIIRLYNRRVMDEQRALLDPIVKKTPHITDAEHGRRTVAAVTEQDWSRFLKKLHGKPPARALEWLDAHFLTAAFMLTHAMAHSGF